MCYQRRPYIKVVRHWASTKQGKVCGNSLFTRLIWIAKGHLKGTTENVAPWKDASIIAAKKLTFFFTKIDFVILVSSLHL